jgi:hypothetical protein
MILKLFKNLLIPTPPLVPLSLSRPSHPFSPLAELQGRGNLSPESAGAHHRLTHSSRQSPPKPRTAFLEERENDEDTIMDHADFECLSWREILSLIDDYYKVNSFLVEKNVLISPDYILPKAIYYVVFRYVICQDIASGRRGRTSIERQLEIKSA